MVDAAVIFECCRYFKKKFVCNTDKTHFEENEIELLKSDVTSNMSKKNVFSFRFLIIINLVRKTISVLVIISIIS